MQTILGPFSQIVTLKNLPPGGPLDDTLLDIQNNVYMGVVDGKIDLIGSRDELKGDAIEVPPNTVAFPGLVDAHTHLCFGGTRARDYALRLSGATYQAIAAEGGGILDTVRKTRMETLEQLAHTTLERLHALLKQGITTCEIKSGYGLSVEAELKILHAIQTAAKNYPGTVVPTCLAAHTLPPEFTSADAYLKYLSEELLPLVKTQALAQRVDIFIEHGAFSPEQGRHYLVEAKRLGFELCLHADQFSRGGALLAAQVGAISADHLEQSLPEDFAAMKHAGVIPIVLPGATLGLGMPFAPARAILDSGLPLAIASDYNPGSAPMGDLLTQAALLGANQRLTTAETWAGITVRAARALALYDRGTLAKGQRADFVLFPCTDYREPLYYQGNMKPCATYINGRKVHAT